MSKALTTIRLLTIAWLTLAPGSLRAQDRESPFVNIVASMHLSNPDAIGGEPTDCFPAFNFWRDVTTDQPDFSFDFEHECGRVKGRFSGEGSLQPDGSVHVRFDLRSYEDYCYFFFDCGWHLVMRQSPEFTLTSDGTEFDGAWGSDEDFVVLSLSAGFFPAQN